MFNFNIFIPTALATALGSIFYFNTTLDNTQNEQVADTKKADVVNDNSHNQTVSSSFTNVVNSIVAPKQEVKQATKQSNAYKLGAGIADITGESAEANMFGYASDKQISTGIHQRLNARAFAINDGKKDVLLIVLESGMVSQAMHQDLLKRLSAKYGNRYTKDNVIFSAIHTHTAPGGYSHYFLYGLTTRGFQEATYDAIMRGTMRAVDRAIDSQVEGSIEFGTNTLNNANVQRSYTAYKNNPEDTTGKREDAHDTTMQVMKFVNNSGKEFASVNWFAVHPTSLTSQVTLVSPDNKGYASWFVEKQKGMDYLKGKGYVSAFANSNAGDMSPNLALKPGTGPTKDQWKNAQIIGQRQADAMLATPTSMVVKGAIDYRQKYVDMSKQQVDPQYTIDGKPHRTCKAAYKTAFAAGSTEDGGGGDDLVASGLVDEGVKNPLIQAIGWTMFWPTKDTIACHETDQVSIVMGKNTKTPMSPEVLPTQLVRIGDLAIVALPGEFTITSGHRIRKQVAKRLGIPFQNVIFSGYSNAYAGYVTTPEEYKQQDYEGSSTHFGPHTLEAWLQNVDNLAIAMDKGEPVTNELTPRDLSGSQMTSVTGVVYDNTPFNVKFGDVATQPQNSYKTGDKAQAVFWSAHPKSTLAYERDLEAQGMLNEEPYTMAIQHKKNGQWVTIATDNDWNTVNEWKRIGTARSNATLTWDIPADAESGEYRFYHKGAYKNGFTGKHVPFDGYSKTFTVN